MLWEITPSNLIDIAFIGIITFICARCLFIGSNQNEKQSQRWKEELKELQVVLRDLIGEASAASSNLDRNLIKRKRELETLLNSLDDRENELKTQLQKIPEVKENRLFNENENQLIELEEVPNETWLEPSHQKPKTSSSANTLNEDIEVIKDKAAKVTYEQTAIVDPIAYKIARRLLAEGKEIHIVARKLEIPVSEVRILDKLMREENTSNSDLDISQEHSKQKGFVSDQPAPRVPTATKTLGEIKHPPLRNEIQIENIWL